MKPQVMSTIDVKKKCVELLVFKNEVSEEVSSTCIVSNGLQGATPLVAKEIFLNII